MPPEFEVDTISTTDQNITSAHPQAGATAVFSYQNHTQTSPAPTSLASNALETEDRLREQSSVLLPRDVWSPPIVSPDADTVWKAGSMVKVVWDTSSRPRRVTNWNGKIVLGYLEDGDENNEHLNFDHPLADGFNLTHGHIMVRVPDVTPSNEYIIVLFGDSGNRSPKFTIVN
ncbi:hypothetical protein C8Q77DRAFT_1152603 [Trametes polyzona]|nr:hypothetical protein C8Q77DRAFT_1152603 [Trametes polyzona]